MSEIIKLFPKIIELNSQSNDIYMILKMVILTTNANLNGAKFTEDFIDGIILNQEKYQGIPLVVNRTKLENEVYDSLSHEFNNGELKTDMVGSFVSFEKQLNGDSSYSLIGEAKIPKRFPKTCEAIIQLNDEDKLRFSCEVLVKEYASIEKGVREISYADGNDLIGNCVVSNPAEIQAKPTLLVASLDEDLKQDKLDDSNLDIQTKQEGGQDMAKKKETKTEVFNKGVEIRYHGQIENCQISFEDISNAIYHQVNYDSEENYVGGYCVCDTFLDHVIVRSWEDDDYFYVNYSIANDEVTIDSQDKWIQGDMVFTPNGQVGTEDNDTDDISTNPMMMEKDAKISELNEQIEKLNTEIATKETEIADLQKVKTEQEIKDEAILGLNTQLNTLKEELATMQPIKEQWETEQKAKQEAEIAEKKEALKQMALNSKVITVEELETEELKNAIEELNEQKIKDTIVERVCVNAKEAKVEVAEKDKDITIIVATEGEDLISKTLKEKYLS